MTLDASGNLLLGTTSNTGGGRVEAVSNATSAYVARSASSGSATTVRAVRSVDSSASYFSNAQYDALSHAWLNSGTEVARIDSSGNLLVGTTSTMGGVTNGSIQVKNDSYSAIIAKQLNSPSDTLSLWNSATTGNNLFAQFYTETAITSRGSISYNRAGGLTVYSTTSDYRAKDISGPVTGSGALIDSIPVYMGKMKWATEERPMFIAHETPVYAHTGEKDAVDANGNPVYQQMDASALIPVMWAEIQSLRKRLADAGI
jgi:hypothetical protein